MPLTREDVISVLRTVNDPEVPKDIVSLNMVKDVRVDGEQVFVSTAGGVAERITSSPGLELFPKFSPDGKWIAFTAQYDGNFNVYVMPATGGEPRQLTFGEAILDRHVLALDIAGLV